MSKSREVTPEERTEFARFWSAQRAAIKERVSEETMGWFNLYTEGDNIGYEQGQLRPGKLGQWDLYWSMTGEQSLGCDQNETLIASGLTAAEVAEEARHHHLWEQHVDPNDPREVAQYERLKRMGPDEIDAEIARLEAQLAASESKT